MQFDTVLKLGTLAIGVAQDEKIRELATIIHKGAKRRGMLPPPGTPVAAQTLTVPKPKPRPAVLPAAKPTTSTAVPPIPFAPSSGATFGGGALGKVLTVDNAKKALDIAGVVKGFLVK